MTIGNLHRVGNIILLVVSPNGHPVSRTCSSTPMPKSSASGLTVGFGGGFGSLGRPGLGQLGTRTGAAGLQTWRSPPLQAGQGPGLGWRAWGAGGGGEGLRGVHG